MSNPTTYDVRSARWSGAFLVEVPSAQVAKGAQGRYTRKSDGKVITGTLMPVSTTGDVTMAVFVTHKQDKGLAGLTKEQLIAKLAAAGIEA